MKTKILIAPFVLFLVFSGCSKIKLDDNGLTPDINSFLPDSILQEMKTLGMVINTGNKPPVLDGTFLISPFVLKNSNISTDSIGRTFSDMYVNFYAYDSKDLTVKVDYVNGPESGDGIGAYVVGDGDTFSVFAEITSKVSSSDSALITMVFSGTMKNDGIANLYFANFMVNNFGNTSGYWIENGQGRVIYDSDGFSELQTSKYSVIQNRKSVSQR